MKEFRLVDVTEGQGVQAHAGPKAGTGSNNLKHQQVTGIFVSLPDKLVAGRHACVRTNEKGSIFQNPFPGHKELKAYPLCLHKRT